MNNRFELTQNWKVYLHKERKKHEQFSFPKEGVKATVPGTIHTDLLKAGLIPDPFYDMNEKALQWIDWNDYRYECQFDLPSHFDLTRPIYLVFEGLDTITEIFLNQQKLASTKNMFRSYRFKVNEYLQAEQNKLQIIFKSARHYGHEYVPQIRQMATARHAERVFVRKSQYSFGWDWGPQFATCGLWKAVYLQQAEGGIKGVTFDVLEFNGATVKIKSEIFLWGAIKENYQINFSLKINKNNGQSEILFRQLKMVHNRNTVELEVQDAALWWPRGYGQPVLHDLQIKLLDENGQEIDTAEKKVGIRKSELVISENGRPVFYFKINDQPVFVRGANWIPAHSFLPEVKKTDYERLLKAAAEANMNILRVWGGGIYEHDYFYQLCDELGLLVWQDFMFACAAYPEDESFISEVKQEIEETVLRLRSHPSIILWNGNNENEWIWYREESAPLHEMPGYRLFHEWLPRWMPLLDPFRPYWPTSPWGMEADPNDENSGNRHVWHIWSYWVDYTEAPKDQSLFVTEFGFQGPAHFQTLKKALPEHGFWPQSESFEWHNKQDEGNERLFRFLAAHFPVRTNMPDFIYLTQLNQALALRSCLRHWRTNQARTKGAIIWQLNDCWPVTSWSLIDFEFRPKISYYHVKDVFASNAVFLVKKEQTIEIFVLLNETNQKYHLEVTGIGEDGRNLNRLLEEEIPISCEREPCFSLKLNDLPEGSAVIVATLYDAAGKRLSRDVLNLKPWKYLQLPFNKAGLKLLVENGLWLSSPDFPCFFAEIRHPQKNFVNQGFVLLPGERELILNEDALSGLDFEKIEIFCLNQYLNRD